MFKALVLILSLVGVSSAMASSQEPQLYSLGCNLDNGVTIKTLINPRSDKDRVVVESRWGFQSKIFSARLEGRDDGKNAIVLKSGAQLYSIVTELDLSSDKKQVVDGVVYGASLSPTKLRVVATARCEVELRQNQ